MEIEELAKKLSALSQKPVLTKPELGEAKALMVKLKQAGMSNAEISQLTGGRWTVPTVKGYTTGIKAAGPSPWQDAISALNDLITAGISLEQAGEAIEIGKQLKSQGVNVADVGDFLAATESAGVDPSSVVTQTKELTAAGISPGEIGELVAAKNELEASGLSLDSLPTLAKLAKSYGNPQAVLEGLTAYGSFNDIQDQIKTSQAKLETTNAQHAKAGGTLEDIKKKASELEAPIKALQKAQHLGFGEQELAALANLADKFGGSAAVFQAVQDYATLDQITKDIGQAKASLATCMAKTEQAVVKHAHLTSAIAMCERLMSEYKFGLDAIGTILSVAGKFGEPIIVLKALETCGKIEALAARESMLEGTITQREKLLAALEGQCGEAQANLDSLHAHVLEVIREAGKAEAKVAGSRELGLLINLMKSPEAASYAENGPVVLLIAMHLKRWMEMNETAFKEPAKIKDGLHRLVLELGGVG